MFYIAKLMGKGILASLASYMCISLCIPYPVAPRLRLEVLNGIATDDSVTRVLAHIGT